MKKFTGSTFFSKHQQGILMQFCQSKLSSRKIKIVFICCKYVLKGEKCFIVFFHFQSCVGVIAYNKIDLAVFQKFGTADGSSIGDFDMNMWKFTVKSLKIRNQKIAADGVRSTDAQRSFQCGHVGNLLFSLNQKIDRRLYVTKECFSFRCQFYPFGISDKEGVP